MNKHLCFFAICLFVLPYVGAAQDLMVELSGTPPTCSDFTNGVVTADISGGTAPYTIIWNTGTDGLQVTGAGGDYAITVTDGDNVTISNTFTLIAPDPIEPVITLMGDACAGSGTLQATISGGTGTYTYAWPDGSTGTSVDGLGNGLHCVTVTDENGCSGVGCLQVSGGISVSLSVIDVTCFNGCDASIEATVSGGVAPYTYAWSNGAPNHPVNANLPFGTYSVTVTDGAGCSAVATINAGNGSQVDVSISSTNPNCDAGSLGSATAMASGGADPYTYAWSNGASSAIADNLSPGTYSVTATDANGCQGTASVVIEDIGSISVDVAASYNCGDATGSATATVTGGSAPYIYTWSNGQSTATATDLMPNTNYSVTVTDANNCSGISSVLISGTEDISVSLTASNPACNGEMTGSILSDVSGGTTPYIYMWDIGVASPNLSNLGTGTYSLTVSDANGCGGTASVTLTQPEILTAIVSTTNATCADQSSGTASVIANGGTAPYTYEWNTGSTDSMLSGLGSGGYMVVVTDANGCMISAMGNILATSDLEVNVSSMSVSCDGAGDGSATAMVVGGNGDYTYAWSNGATTASINGLNGGIYIVTVSENGCSGTGSTTVNEATAVEITAIVSTASCDGGDATASASASGGTVPYTYAWSTGDNTSTVDGLSSGSYTVTATDAAGCTATTSVTVSTDAISVSISGTDAICAGEASASAIATVSGGSAPYTYVWSNGQTEATISNILAAGYMVTVTDANGCTATSDILLGSNPVLQLNISSTNATCGNMADGTATVSVNGGVGPYTYSWSNGSTNPSISNLGGGTYTVTVTDAVGCSATRSTTISQSAMINITLTPTPTCEDFNDGAVTATVSGGSPTYNYQWNNGETGSSISNLNAGIYSLTVTDGQGCTQTATTTVSAFTVPSVSITVDQQIILVGGNEGILTAVASGEGPFTYTWNNGESTAMIENLSAGTYTVTVTNTVGCSSTDTVVLEQLAPAKVGNFVWNDFNRNGIQDAGEQGLEGVLVRLDGIDAMGNEVISGATTDETGFYLIDNLNPGTYKLIFEGPTSYEITTINQGENDALDSDVNSDRMTNFFTLSAGECNFDMDGGFYDQCVNLTNGGSIAADQRLCKPNDVAEPITNVTPPSGGQGDLEIIWMRNEYDVPFGDPSWEIIPDATGLSYAPGEVAATTYFARCARRNGCSFYFESNLVRITVGPVAIPVIVNDEAICVNEDYTFFASPGGSGTVYNWNFGPGSSPSTANGQFVTTRFNSTGNKTIELTVTKDGCSASSAKVVNVNNNPDVCENFMNIGETRSVHVFPNPVQEKMTLRVPTAFQTDAIVDVVNSRGQIVLTTIWQGGIDEITIQLTSYPAGIYYVRVQRAEQAPGLVKFIKR